MDSDIVDRLRGWRSVHLARLHLLMEEAAAEIELTRGYRDEAESQAAVASLAMRLTEEERIAVGIALQCIESSRCQKHPEELAAAVNLLRASSSLEGLLKRLGGER